MALSAELKSDDKSKLSDQLVLPDELIKLVQLFGLADYFMLDDLRCLIAQKIATNKYFIQFTNVRRILLIYMNQMTNGLLEKIIEHVPADLLIFLLTDPIIF